MWCIGTGLIIKSLAGPAAQSPRGRDSKDLTKRPKKSSFRRPIHNGEYHLGESRTKLRLQSLSKIDRRTVRIVGKCPTAPSAENERNVTVGSGNGEHTVNALLQQVTGFRLPDGGGIRSR